MVAMGAADEVIANLISFARGKENAGLSVRKAIDQRRKQDPKAIPRNKATLMFGEANDRTR